MYRVRRVLPAVLVLALVVAGVFGWVSYVSVPVKASRTVSIEVRRLGNYNPDGATTRQTIISGTSDDPTESGTTQYSSLMGDGNILWNSTSGSRQSIIPTSGVLTNFKVGVTTAPGEGNSWTFTIRKGTDATALSVTIAEAATLSSLDTDNVSVAAGDKVDVSAVGGSTPTAAAAVHWRCDFIPDIEGETILLGNSDSLANPYSPLVGSKSTDTPESEAQTLFPTAGTLKKFFVELSIAPGVGNSRTFTVRLGGSTNLTVTISGLATTGSDTDAAHDVDISAGNLVSVMNTSSGSPAAAYLRFGVVFLPDTPGEWIASATIDDYTNSGSAEYHNLNCADDTLNTTESEHQGLCSATTAKKIYVDLAPNAPGVGNSWYFTLRESGASTALTVTISGETYTGNAAIDEPIAADAKLATLIDARAGLATTFAQIAYLFYNAPESADPNISNDPSSKAFGVISPSSTYYAFGSAPSNPVSDNECTFTVTNSSGFAVDLAVKGTNFTGGTGWTLTSGAPGENTVRMTVYYSGQNPASGVVLTTSDQSFITALADTATKKWDFKFETGTFTDGAAKSSTITMTAAAS